MLTRRLFLQSSAATAASFALPSSGRAAVQVSQTMPLRQLGYSQVTLLAGPLLDQFRHHHRVLMSLEDDKLLKPFRERAGLAAPGEDMGGWYSNSPFFDPHGSFEGYVPGHSFGQFVSALSRAGAVTQDKATLAKVNSLVSGLAPTLTSRFYDGYTLPAYTFDKICGGLVDAHDHAGVTGAGPLLEVALAAAVPHLPEKALSRPEQRARPHSNDAQTWDESYTLPENLFLAYQRTGKSVFRDAATRFLEDDLFFNPLSEGINVLPGEHAYSHVNAFSSAMQAYLTLGSEKHLRAARQGFQMLEEQSFATGGWGPGETLLRPGTDDLGRSLLTQPASFETPCGAYGHFKIARYLLCATGDPHYGDSLERVLYNTVLGARPLLADGTSFYYSDYSMTGHKSYSRDKWPCCSGTLPQITADYGVTFYFRGTPRAGDNSPADPHGISVVLYVPSRVTWQHNGSNVTLQQETAYPAAPSSTLTITTEKGANFTLALRIPKWAGPATRVLVNGKPVSPAPQAGTFCTVRRAWRNGDRIDIEFDMKLRTEKLTVNAMRSGPTQPQSLPPLSAEAPAPTPPAVATSSPVQLAALLRGPVVFMATGLWPTEFAEADLLAANVSSAGDILSVTPPGREAVALKPYASIGDEAYRCYQPLRPA